MSRFLATANNSMDLSGNVTDIFSLNAFGGNNEFGTLEAKIAAEEMTSKLPGILALVGAFLCMFQKKSWCITGGVLIIVACVLTITLIYDSWILEFFTSFLNPDEVSMKFPYYGGERGGSCYLL